MPAWTRDTVPADQLRGFVTTLLMRMMAADETSWNTQLMLREVIEPSDVCSSLVEDYLRPMFDLLVGIVARLLPETAEHHVVKKVAFSIVGQCLYYRVSETVVSTLLTREERRGHFQPQQLAQHIVDFSLAACGAGPPLGPAPMNEEDKSLSLSDSSPLSDPNPTSPDLV